MSRRKDLDDFYKVLNELQKRVGGYRCLRDCAGKSGCCTPSANWLGRFSPSEKIRHFGLWQVQHTNGAVLEQGDLDYLEASR